MSTFLDGCRFSRKKITKPIKKADKVNNTLSTPNTEMFFYVSNLNKTSHHSRDEE
ncbi:hypothetical protein GCM10020331_078330 [Ectobacillus funiculus]